MNNGEFASLYSQWIKSHDERSEIERKTESDNRTSVKTYTIGELRRMKVQDELDLHNYTLDKALEQMRTFISESVSAGLKKIRIVTGKGLHSPDGIAVLRPAVIAALESDNRIREIDVNPKDKDGGSGAVIVLLKQK